MKGIARRTLLSKFSLLKPFSFSRNSQSKHHHHLIKSHSPIFRGFQGFKAISTAATSNDPTNSTKNKIDDVRQSMKHNPLLEQLRMRQLKGASSKSHSLEKKDIEDDKMKTFLEMNQYTDVVSNFGKLGLSDEVMVAVKEMAIWGPTEIQCVGIPALLEGKNVVLASDIESGATLAYLLPIIQLLRHDEAALGVVKPRHPRAVVLCPTIDLSDEVLNVTKTIRSHFHIKSSTTNGGADLVAGTPNSILQQFEDGHMAYDDIKYLVLEDIDTMFDTGGFGDDICKFLDPLKEHDSKFQIVLVISSITKMISEHLSSVVEKIEQNNSGKIAGILLEMDQTELVDLALSSNALKKKITEAMLSLG